MKYILPSEVDGNPFEGHGAQVVVIDAEGTFSVEGLTSMVYQRLINCGLSEKDAMIETRKCTDRLFIMACSTRRELLLGIARFCDDTASNLSACALLIDGYDTLTPDAFSLRSSYRASRLQIVSPSRAASPLSNGFNELHSARVRRVQLLQQLTVSMLRFRCRAWAIATPWG